MQDSLRIGAEGEIQLSAEATNAEEAYPKT